MQKRGRATRSKKGSDKKMRKNGGTRHKKTPSQSYRVPSVQKASAAPTHTPMRDNIDPDF